MARGFIYEITDSKDSYPLGAMDKDALAAELGGTEFSYADDASLEESMVVDTLKQFGFPVHEEADGTVRLTASRSAKKNYFQKRFCRLKSRMDSMTLSEFIGSVADVQELLEDVYGDAAYFDGCFYTFDKFLRSTEDGKEYYIGKVCLMG